MANDASEKKKEPKAKKSSALKRAIQGEKNRLRNRSHRAALLTAIRDFEGSLSKKDAVEQVRGKLNKVYSLMDKGVKKGVFPLNKAARTKSRLHARISAS
jgi:small subunit ribosomal protein S20